MIPDADAALDAFLADCCVDIPLSQKTQVLQAICHRRIAAAASRDYETASRLSQAEESLRRHFQATRDHDRATRRVQSHLAAASPSLSALLDSTAQSEDAKRAAYAKGRDDVLSGLRLRHAAELERFNRDWATRGSFPRYSKASPFLLQLREVERRRVPIGDHDGAEFARRFGADVQRDETAVARGRVVRRYEVELARLVDRQRGEIEAAIGLTTSELGRMQRRAERNLRPIEMALRKAETREEGEEDVIRAKSGRTRRERSPRDEGDDIDAASPRTAETVGELRRDVAVSRLDLLPLDVPKYVAERERAKSHAGRRWIAARRSGRQTV
jgi:hypothetical protein